MIGASPPKPRPPVKRRKKRRRSKAPAQNESTRVQILQSAAAAFRTHGYHGATVQRIAASLRMEKGNLYYYFRNKEEILFACHQYSLDRLIRLLDEISDSDESPDEKIRTLIVALVHTILDELHGTTLFTDLGGTDAGAPQDHHRAARLRRSRHAADHRGRRRERRLRRS